MPSAMSEKEKREERLAAALSRFQPYLRGAPEGLPFRFDAATIRRGLNFTLRTTAGDIDVLGEVAGVGGVGGDVVQGLPLGVPGRQVRIAVGESLPFGR